MTLGSLHCLVQAAILPIRLAKLPSLLLARQWLGSIAQSIPADLCMQPYRRLT